MKNKILISFIIPAYNCEHYISYTLDSIYSKNIESGIFEVIVVNDGSHDNTENILNKYNQTRNNFKYCTISNSGAGEARNVGLRIAKGKYIQFIDSDDFLAECDCVSLIKFLETSNVDIVNLEMSCGGQKDGFFINQLFDEAQVEYLTGIEHIIKHNTISSPVKYIFRRNYLIDNGLFFSSIQGGGEDVEHTIYSFYKASTTAFVSWGWYVVRSVDGSLTRNFSLKIERNICEIVPSVLTHFRAETTFVDNKAFRDRVIDYLLILFQIQDIKLTSVPIKALMPFYTSNQQNFKIIVKLIPHDYTGKSRKVLRYLKLCAFNPYLAFVDNMMKRLYGILIKITK